MAAIEFRGHCTKLKWQMIALYPRYCLSEKLTKQLKNMESHSTGNRKDVHVEIMQAYLDVATNLTSYCRALVSAGGKKTLHLCLVNPVRQDRILH